LGFFFSDCSASVSSNGLNYVTQSFIPILKAALANIAIPGTSGTSNGFDFSLSNIQCGNFDIASATVSTNGAATVAVNGLAVSCSASWSFKLHIWPHLPRGSGTVDISVSNTNAVLGVAVTADPTLHPVVSVTSSSLNIGSINLSFHGSVSSVQ
jgi:LBP / BPI / CETP family, N-terminal domain